MQHTINDIIQVLIDPINTYSQYYPMYILFNRNVLNDNWMCQTNLLVLLNSYCLYNVNVEFSPNGTARTYAICGRILIQKKYIFIKGICQQ